MSSDNFELLYADFVKNYLHRELKISDGISNEKIVKAEIKLGRKLPKALRDYYQTVGSCCELNNYHNRIIDLEKVFLENGFLIFAEENEYVVYWGIKTGLPEELNPTVWQIQNKGTSEYHTEEKSFTEFMTEMFEWQFKL
jgi:hypothetical protein